MKNYLSLKDFYKYCDDLAEKIRPFVSQYKGLYPIPMGGFPIAIPLSEKLNLPIHLEISEGDLVVDDLVDSGKTLSNTRFSKHDKAVLFIKNNKFEDIKFYATPMEGWIVFPHEKKNDMDDFVFRILEYFGENPSRNGLENVASHFLNYFNLFLGQDKNKSNFAPLNHYNYNFYFLDKTTFFPCWGNIQIKDLHSLSFEQFEEFTQILRFDFKKLFSYDELLFKIEDIFKSFNLKESAFIDVNFETLEINPTTNEVKLLKKSEKIRSN